MARPVTQALHEPDLPQRLAAIQALGEDPAGQRAQLGILPGRGQRGVAHVVLKIEVGVVNPARTALAQGHLGQALAVAGHQGQAVLDVVKQLAVRRRVSLEDEDGGHVHVRGPALLQVQERGVEARQPVRVAHRAPSCQMARAQNRRFGRRTSL